MRGAPVAGEQVLGVGTGWAGRQEAGAAQHFSGLDSLCGQEEILVFPQAVQLWGSWGSFPQRCHPHLSLLLRRQQPAVPFQFFVFKPMFCIFHF